MLVTQNLDGSDDWKCRSANSDGSLNCDSVTYPRFSGDTLMPVRFNATYNLEVVLRIFNSNGAPSATAPYRALLHASSRDWLLTYDTGYLAAIGSNQDSTEWVTHTWYNNAMIPSDTLTLSLKHIERQTTSSFWADYSLQFQSIRLILNTTYDPNHDQLATGYSSWLYGEFNPPPPPPPPPFDNVFIGLAAEG